MIRLTELVELLCDAAERIGDANPRVLVRWYADDGTQHEREIEMLFPDVARDCAVLHVPRAAQLAGEQGAGDVVDESNVDELDLELVLGFATGERGCECPDGRCVAGALHPECRERLKRENLERVRAGERSDA